MKKILQTLINTLQLVNCTLHTAYRILHTAYRILNTPNRTLKTENCNPNTKHRTPNTATSILKTKNCKLQTANCKLPTAYCLLLTVFLSFLTFQQASAQIYPIQVNPQLIPPYSLKLSDYQTTSSEKLFVNILLTDTQEIGRRVRLKMRIEGNGYNIQNTDVVAGATPIYLDGGINQRLSNLDLRPYFELNNLLGIAPQQYTQPLPSGRYDFCFEVYDFFSGQLLSRKSCFSVYLILNDPPILNLPFRGDLVTAKNPQNLLFSWTPRHLNATGVQYEFTLKELWDTTIDPQAAFLSSPPLYQTTTYTSTLLYGPADIPLLEGKKYAWQVRAIVSDGISETSVFKNNGYSEIFNFTYQGNCEVPKFVLSEAQNTQTVQITWLYSDHIRYQIQYRKKGYGDDDWFNLYAYNQQGTIHNLEAGTTYEFRVGGECTPEGGFAFSGIQKFTTPTVAETAYYNCGVLPQIKLTNQNPLKNIGVNEVFTAGDFPITVKSVTNAGVTYSGWGFITVPYLADTKIRVDFKNIKINTDYQLVDGIVETSYDPKWKGIADIDAAIADLTGSNGEVATFDATNIALQGVKVVDGQVVLINVNGTETTIDTKPPVVITDKNGKTFTVNEQGQVTEGQAAVGGAPNKSNTTGVDNSGNVNLISSKDVEVLFEPGNGKYTFDTNPNQDKSLSTNAAHNSTYETIKKADGSNYYVHYKAVSDAPYKEDEVNATAIFSNGKTKENLVFKTQNGNAVAPSWSGNVATFKLTKQFDYAKDAIIATVKPADSTAKYEVAGKIDLWHLTAKKVNVVLVSINDAPIPSDAAKNLNEVYNKAGIEFVVTPKNLNFANTWGETIQTGNSDLLNTYTDGQQLVTQAVMTALGNEYKTDTYYMLYTNEKASNSDAGFMPLLRQFGFVFDGENRTLAHELGHGVFGLKHPFSKDADQRKTNLLMDYGGGELLSHNDWEIMHAPGLQLYQFTQGSSAGANREANELDLLGNIFKITENEKESGNILVGRLSNKTPYLIIGFDLYRSDDVKLLASFEGKIINNEVVYQLTYKDTDYKRVSEIGGKMPYPVTITNNGNAVIKILNDVCTYGTKDIYWEKPENSTTEIVINKINNILKNDNKFKTVALYSQDPTCSVVNSMAALIDHDHNQCPINVRDNDIKKLNLLFSKSTFTNIEIVNLIVNEKICFSALEAVEWKNLKKAFEQLSLSSEIKNEQEIAILRIMCAIKSDNLSDFYNLLAQNNHAIIINLNKQLHDYSINLNDTENYTSFYQGLLAMFAINNKNIENLIPLDSKEAYTYLKNFIPEVITGFNDSNYYYEYVTNHSAKGDFKITSIFWESITYDKRIALMDDIINNNSPLDKSEEILLNLFIHEKDSQKITYELEKSNYSLFWKTYKVLDGKELKYFVQDVLYKTLIYKQITNDFANNLALSVKNKYNTLSDLKGVRTEPYFMFYDKGIFNIVSNDGAVLNYDLKVTRALLDNSKIQFSCSMQVLTSDNVKAPVQHLFSLAPYEYVVLEIPKDFTVDGRQFKKGLFAVPAIYAYWIANAVEDKNDAILFRLVADGIAIALAPFTSGGSLLALELTMVSLDVVITVTNYNNPDAISPKYNAYWDAIYGIYNLPKAVTGLSSISRGVFQFVIKEGKYIQSVKIIRSNIKNFVSDFKGLDETERLTHLNKIDNLLEAISNGIKGGTLSPDEIRVSKKMYDMIFEARIKCQNIDQNLSSIIDITVDNSSLFLNNGITASQKIADVSISQNIVNLSNIAWQPTSIVAKDVQLINTFNNILYVDKAGQTINGALNIVEDLSKKGTFYVTPKLLGVSTLASRLESPSLLTLKNEVNALGSLKPIFLEDFANVSDDILRELDDIVRFEDDYTAFKTLWKSASGTELSNAIKDLDKFKVWWYPQKIKVVDELFTNQRAFEGTLNNRFTNIEKIPSSVRGEAWNYYKQQKWDKLESLFKEYKINLQKVVVDGKTIEIIWPPANGGFNKIGETLSGKYDRYGAILKIENGVPILTGNFTSPILNDNKYSFSQRALNQTENKYDLYYEIEVLKPLPFKAETTTVIPWFKELGGVGGGKQTMWIIDKGADGYSKSMTKLSEEGYIKITIKSSPNSKYPELVNKTIIDGKLSGDHAIFNKLNNIGNDVNKLNSWINQKDIPQSLLNKLETLSLSELKRLSLDIEETTSLQNLLKTNPENGLEAWKIYRQNLPTDLLCK